MAVKLYKVAKDGTETLEREGKFVCDPWYFLACDGVYHDDRYFLGGGPAPLFVIRREA